MQLSPAQRQVSDSTNRFRCLVAGRRFGKSFLSINEIAKFATQPDRKVIYISPTFGMSKAILWDELKNRLYAVRWVKKVNESNLEITLKNNTKIMLRSADNPDTIRGQGYDFAVVDEAQDCDKRLIPEILRPALADRQGALLVIGTPKGIGNHLYEIYKDPNYTSWQFTTLSGGRVSEEEIEAARNLMDARTFKQEFEASFETYAGVIYYAFTTDNIVDATPDFDDRETLHIGMDFNTSPVSAVVAIKRQEQLYIVDEIEIFNSNTNEMVDEIRTRYPKNPVVCYPDASGQRRQTSSNGISDHVILQNAGFRVHTGRVNPPVVDRIAAVNGRLCNTRGARNLIINKANKRVIESLVKQTYKEGTRIPDKETGLDHFADAIGYLVHGLWPIKPESRTLDQPTTWSVY